MAIPVESVWKIYYYIALFSTILFVLKLVLFATVGGDTEVAADFNSEVDTDCSFNFISIQSVIAFFMGFGWMGYSALKQFELSQLISFGAAFGVGIIFMFLTAYLMFLVKNKVNIWDNSKEVRTDFEIIFTEKYVNTRRLCCSMKMNIFHIILYGKS